MATPGIASTNPQANVAPTTIFDPNSYQGGLNNVPGKSLFDTNTSSQIASAGYTPNSALSNQSLTVLSSNKTPDITNIKNTTDGLAKTGATTDTTTGITTDASGNPYTPLPSVTGTTTNSDGSTTQTYSDGSQKVIPSEGHSPTALTGGYINGVYYPQGATKPQNADGTYGTPQPTDPANDAILKSFNDQIAANDSMTASLISNITQQYQQLIQQQQQTNAGAEAGLNTFLLKAGSLQGTQSGQQALQGQVSFDIQKIGTLNSQEQTAILQAKQAGQNQDFQLQDKINQQIQSIRDEKIAAATKLQDTITAANVKLSDQKYAAQQAQQTAIQTIATDAAKNGATPDQIKAITSATNVDAAIAVAGDSLHTMTGDFADYPQYLKDAKASGQAPLSATAWLAQKQASDAALKSKEAYGTAFATASGKAAGEAKATGNAPTSVVTSPNGIVYNPPASIAPYTLFASNGVKYVDLSAFKGTPTEANQAVQDAQAAGYRVITNKNSAADLQNIQNALANLQTIKSAFDPNSAGNAAQRNVYAAGLNKLTQFLQTNPDQAAIDTFQDSALDILKAVSGIQGFRGGQGIIQQVKDTFPQITDTKAVVDQKIANISTLITNRETALVGQPNASDKLLNDAANADKTVTTGLNNIKTSNPTLFKAASTMYTSNNPATGQPYTAQDILQAFPELNTP